MKHVKKLVSLLLALVMVMGLTVTVSAGETETNTGSGTITINKAVEGQTYTIYQILTLESYNASTNAYSYKAATGWETFIKSATTYVTVGEQEYVTWVEGADAAAFAKEALEYAKEALEYAKENSTTIAKTATKKADSTTVEFTGLNLGYYLVDSTLGTLCFLDTTNPTVTIEEKNGVPTNEKMVQEDSKVGTDDEYGKLNDADINQEVKFQSTITAQAGAENYVFHDKMSAGLTFGSVTGITLNNEPVDSSMYTVKTTDLTDDCTFEVVFKQTFCDALKANDKIVISYTATLNANAVVGLPGNPNESKLSYGDSSNTKYTPASTTTTYTWDMDILKYGNGDDNDKKVLAGAEFILLKKDKDKDIVATFEGGKLTGWVELEEDATIPDAATLKTGADGKIHIVGLDADTYYLRETKAPDGYNKLASDITVKITGATDGSYSTKLVEVENKTGTELPSTGGMGTTIFYVIGSILVLGAAVLLVTRKRMNA